MRTLAIANQKGGCGKTITAINLSAFLAREQRRVLLVDMDPQGHATLGVMREPPPLRKTIYDALLRGLETGQTSLRDIIIKASGNIDVAPSDILLSALPEKLATVKGRESRLSEALEEIHGDYDYVIVDCPPSVGLLTFNALMACTEAIIPVEPSFFSLHGIGKQLETLEMLVRQTGHVIAARALITLYTGRHDFVRAVVEEIRRHLGDRSFNTAIRFSVKLAEAASHGQPIAEFRRRSAGFEDYQSLAREVLGQEAARPMQAGVSAGAAAPVPGKELVQPEAPGRDLAEPSAPVPTKEGVLFTLAAPDAHCVQLAGDFNGWVPDGNEMESCGRVWRKVIPLPPGRYHYRYVVDGRWQSDPSNSSAEPAPFGGFNSMIVLEDKNLPH